MIKNYRFSHKSFLRAFVLVLCMQACHFSFAQTIDDFCNCENGFPTLTPPAAYENGVILASKFFRFLPPAARRIVSNRCFVIDAPFVFDEPIIRRFSNCNFTMTEGAAIIIPEGKPGFHFRGGSMKSCDGEMWSGIQVQKGAFIDLEASTLGGAQTAVQVQDSAILNIRGTIFDGNIIGIDVLPDAAPLGVPVFGNTFRNGSVGINNMGLLYVGAASSINRFGPNLDAGVIGANGITNINNSVFDQCNVGILTSNSVSIDMRGNRFTNCAYGIQDINSNIKIEENVFQNIQFTAVQLIGHIDRNIEINFNIIDGWYGIEGTQIFSDNIAITYNNITAKGNFYSGISMSGVYTDNSKIEKNTIFGTEDVLDGAAILLSSCNGLDVSQNYIELQSGKASGLSIVNTQNSLISENAVTGTQQQVGVVLENSNVDLYCNEFFNQANGILIKGFSMSNIATNFIAGSAVGVFYQKTAVSGPQLHHGNLFQGNSLGAFHGNDNKSFYELSTFAVASDETPIHPNAVFPKKWFVVEENMVTQECGSASRSDAGTGFTGKTDPREMMYRQIANGSLYSGAENAALQFESERFLFEEIQNNSVSAQGDYQWNASRISELNNVQNRINNLYKHNQSAQTEYTAGRSRIAALSAQVEDFNIRINAAFSKNIIAELTAKRAEIISDLKNLIAENNLLQASLELDFQNNVAAVRTELNQISVEEIFEINEKFVQSMLLQLLADGIHSFNFNQISQLKALSVGSPHADGMAVYKAKGLLARIENQTPVFDFETSFPKITSVANRTSAPVLHLEVFPNPTTETLFVRLPQTNEERNAVVFDLTGNQVISKKLSQNAVNVSDLSEGFYFLKIFQNDQLVGVEKFSVVK